MPYPVGRKEEIPGDKKEQRDGSDESRKVGVYGSRGLDLDGPHGQKWGLAHQRATVKSIVSLVGTM